MTVQIPFTKMHGLGNDFVLLRSGDLPRALNAEDVQRICDRRRGVGCDQLIVLEPCAKADIFMHIYNPDGSRAGACGNATRCVAELVHHDTGITKDITIKTDFAILTADKIGAFTYRVNMGRPLVFAVEGLSDVQAHYHLPAAMGVNIGNPHCVFFMEYAPNDDTLSKMGRMIESHAVFPDRTNVEFAVLENDGSIRMRVWERGAGITQACGSGGCATAAAAIALGHKQYGQDISVALDGGTLTINWASSDDGVLMSGPTAYAFNGHIAL